MHRELLLIKVRADAAVRAQVVTIVDMFRAHVVDVTPDSMTIEATGTTDKLEGPGQDARAVRRP